MQTYRRSKWVLIKGIVSAPAAALLVFAVLTYFSDNPLIVLGIPCAILLLVLYMSLFSENIFFELDETGKFRYFKRGRLKKEYNLRRCLVGYRMKSESGIWGNHDITLQIQALDAPENPFDDYIDCSPLGPGRFDAMFDRMRQFTGEQAEVLRADKAD